MQSQEGFEKQDIPQAGDPPKAMLAACCRSDRSPEVPCQGGEESYKEGFHEKPHNTATEMGEIPPGKERSRRAGLAADPDF